jgi:hypothetical protein
MPKLKQGKGEYKIYFLPTDTKIIPQTFLAAAIKDAYEELDNKVFKIAITNMNEIKERGLHLIGHNFFGLFGEFLLLISQTLTSRP